MHANTVHLLTILLSVSSPPVTGLGAVRKEREKKKKRDDIVSKNSKSNLTHFILAKCYTWWVVFQQVLCNIFLALY